MNKDKIIIEINSIIERIRCVQNEVPFDTTETSEVSLDMAVAILADVRGMVDAHE